MVAFTSVKAGDMLWDCRKVKAGNTTMTRLSCWRVKVIEVTEDWAMCSWNGNPPRKYYPHHFNALRRTKKEGRT